MPKKRRKHKMAEDLDSEVLVISNSKQFRIQLKLLLDQSPILEGISYPPIGKICFQQFNDEIIKKMIQFCKYQIIHGFIDEEEKEELIKFAEKTKMDKLKDYINQRDMVNPDLEAQGEILPQLPAINDISDDEEVESENDEEEDMDDEEVFHPHIEPQGAFIPLPQQTSINDISDDEEEDRPSAEVYSINAISIKPIANPSEDRIRVQSYIPQDPLHSLPQMAVLPAAAIPWKPSQRIIISASTAAAASQHHQHPPLSRAPSSAEEAEEGIIGEKIYESVAYVPAENLTFQPIPAPIAAAAAEPTFMQRFRSFFS